MTGIASLAGGAELVLRHHENFDGTDYPLGVKGEEIPVEYRILAIAIAHRAMINPPDLCRNTEAIKALAGK